LAAGSKGALVRTRKFHSSELKDLFQPKWCSIPLLFCPVEWPLKTEECMQLYLIQHGAAKSEAEDPQRSLTAEGTKTVERMAQYLSHVTLLIDRIEHSDKQRARQTAEIMAAHLHPAEAARQVAGLAPNDDVSPMRELLQNESKSLMIVGHLPYLSRLVSALLGLQQERSLVAFQMGGVVHLERDENGEWRVRWILAPELLSEHKREQRNAA
jgi:phosphohistidine phosphatase